MQTNINFGKLKGLPLDQQKSLLAQAIDLEMRLPAILMDVFEKQPQYLNPSHGGNRGFIAPNGAQFGLTDEQVNSRIKSFLMRHPEKLLGALQQKELSSNGGMEGAKAAVFGTKYATASDNPILTDLSATFAAFFHSNMPDVDIGWMNEFDLVDLRNSPHDHFDIDDTNAGITYTQQVPGGIIDKRTAITESKTSVPYLTYGAGIGLLDDWLTKQLFWKIDEVIAEFRAKYYDKKAELHYGLFTAQSSGIDQAFATDDATTFNAAAASIIRNVRNQGYAVGQNTTFNIKTSPEKVGRVLAMLEARQGSQMVAFGTMKQPIAFQVGSVVASTYISSSDTGYYLSLPGKKTKRGEWQDLTVEQQRNAAGRSYDWYGSGQFNGAIGDTNQIRRVKFA